MLQIKRSLLAGMAISLLVLSCNEKGKNQTTDTKNDKDQTIVADPPKEESKEGMNIADAKRISAVHILLQILKGQSSGGKGHCQRCHGNSNREDCKRFRRC